MMDFATGKPLPDSRILAKISSLLASNGMVSDSSSFPWACPEVARAYGIDDEALQRAPSQALPQWAQLLADVAFRIPTVHVALSHAAGGDGVLVYHMRCANPFPKWESSYGKANHAINDLFVFSVAEDQVPEELRDQYRGCVAQVRSAWLDFCYGKQPWKPMRAEGGALGPLFSFENGPAGREAETLEQALGDEVAGRWRLVIKTLDSKGT